MVDIKHFIENYKNYDEDEIDYSIFRIKDLYEKGLEGDFMLYFIDKIKWFLVCRHQVFPEKIIEFIIEKWKDELHWNSILDSQILSDNFVEKYKKEIMKANNFSYEEQFENWKMNRKK